MRNKDKKIEKLKRINKCLKQEIKILSNREKMIKVVNNKEKLKNFEFESNILKEKFNSRNKEEKKDENKEKKKEETKKDDKKNKRHIPKRLKTEVWIKYIENGRESRIGKCYCCQITEIYIDNHQCGHVVSKNDGGTEIIENLRPICGSCNGSMGTKNMVDFIIKHELWN